MDIRSERNSYIPLKCAIIKAVDNTKLRSALGVAAKNHVVEHHSLQAMALRWEATYTDAIARNDYDS